MPINPVGRVRMERATIRIYGIVQGVGMRYFIAWRAKRLGLSGYVRNLEDGSVEAVVEGSKDLIEELVRSIKEEGPGFVSDVKVLYSEFVGDLRGFEIIP